MNRHRTLLAWQRARELAVEVHRAAARLPAAERFELGSQLRRAAVSVPANIAEGCARHGVAEFAHGVSIALGSLAEVDTLLDLVRELNCLDGETLDRLESLRDRTSAATFTLQRRLRGSSAKSR
jgi:four helix bundle protein